MTDHDRSDDHRPIGDIIDGLNCNARLGEGDLIADAVVILKIVDPDGLVRLAITWGEGMSWVERRGMLESALDMERINPEDQR